MFIEGPPLQKKKKWKDGHKEFADVAMCFMGPTRDFVAVQLEFFLFLRNFYSYINFEI